MFKVLYRCEQPQSLQKITKKRYITIDTYLDCTKRKDAIELAIQMNRHIKKFHQEKFGKNVYFVKEV